MSLAMGDWGMNFGKLQLRTDSPVTQMTAGNEPANIRA
jgi:hypothetical protein